MPVTERSVLYKILIFTFIALNLKGQTYPDPKVDALLNEGINNVILQNYNRAELVFNELDHEFPGIPLGKIFLAGNSMSESFDLGTAFENNYIDSLLTASYHMCEELLDKEPENEWYNYFAGLTYGFQGYSYALSEDYINAFVNGFNSLQYFDKCLLINPLFHEAKIVIGSYLYWKADKTLDLSWLPFFSDDKKKGIALLKSASDSANYIKHFAEYSLMWIYYNENDYQSAINVAQKFLAKHPESRLFQLGLAKSLRFSEKERALEVFKSILLSYRQLSNNNHLQEILILKMIAELQLELGWLENVLETCEQALVLNVLNKDLQIKSEFRIKTIKEIKTKAEELLAGN